VQPRQRISQQAKRSLLVELARRSFASVKETHGAGYSQLKKILMELPTSLLAHKAVDSEDASPLSLGIDEHSFRGRNLVISITAPVRKQLLSILPDDRQKTLRSYLASLPVEFKSRVDEVCIDMKVAFAEAIRVELPQAQVVVDKFHIVADANRRLDETRRLEQEEARKAIPRWPLVKGAENLSPKQKEQLATILKEFPNLGEFYYLKEKLREMYRASTKEEARGLLESVILNAENADDVEAFRWGRTLRFWRESILNYFNHRLTNGYTEGAHTKIKLTKRLSYGFRNVQVYIRKMLLAFLPTWLITQLPHILT